MTRSLRILSVISPMTQLNTPYPSTAFLTGFLRSRGFDAVQVDLALELALDLLSPAGLERLHEPALSKSSSSPVCASFVEDYERYQATVLPVIRFLQGQDPTLAHRIVSRRYLPEGPRFGALHAFVNPDGGDALAWAFGSLGLQDHARHLATLYLNNLADVVRDAADPRFEFVRYAERLARSESDFGPMAAALEAEPTLVDRRLDELARAALQAHEPSLLLLSVPFPGAVYAALRIAREAKRLNPAITTVLGGGWVNTELRHLQEPRLFDHIDFVTLDAGERPLLALLEHLAGTRSIGRLVRTYLRHEGKVRYCHLAEPDIPFEQTGTPTWDGLPLGRYLSLLDMLNPMHRLWSDGRWNKLVVALGCYWKKCSFCDVGLDYIARYETLQAATLVDRIEAIVAETGQTGFHFVDEAAPPKALRALAEELLRRRLSITWWGNVRFEKTFTPELCELLAESGCIAVTGGLEVASDRLLTLMDKGVSVDQVARVTHAFSEAGVLVHAYLMYGFPTQTEQDTVDALELVRQLFAAGCLQSGFFHRFACTVHSPVGQDPARFGIRLLPLPEGGFARNDVGFVDPTGCDHDRLGFGLRKAIYNFMHGIGLESDVREWFDAPVPRPRVGKRRIERALREAPQTRQGGV